MTYYGDATLHGVFATKESAEAKARAVAAETRLPFGTEWDPITVQETEIEP